MVIYVRYGPPFFMMGGGISMATRKKVQYECIECGYHSPISYGKCPQCSSWGSMVESVESGGESGKGIAVSAVKPVPLKEIDQLEIRREITGLEEFDRVLGGGIVPDSVVLIGGEPGVGIGVLGCNICIGGCCPIGIVGPRIGGV